MRMLCTYTPKPGQEEKVLHLLKSHLPTLREVGLAGDKAGVVWRSRTKDGTTRFVERFDWAGPESPNIAHQLPAVMAVWEPLGALCDAMEFAVVDVVIGSE